MEDDSDRLRKLEIGQARVEEKLEVIRHDASNTRQMITGMGTAQASRTALQDQRHLQLETDIKALSKSLVQTGMSVVGAVIMLIISMLAYFIVERMNMIQDNHDAAIQAQVRSK